MRAVLVALAATMASAQTHTIVDYVTASDVTAHNAIDLDVRDLANFAKEGAG